MPAFLANQKVFLLNPQQSFTYISQHLYLSDLKRETCCETKKLNEINMDSKEKTGELIQRTKKNSKQN